MALLGDRVQETTTTTGTGQLTLNGAVTGYVTFNSTFTNGDIVWYVVDDGAGNWEIGSGTVGTGTLTRSVFQSSNANALVPFSAGTKRVFCTAPYTYFLPDQTGNNGKFLTTNGTTPSWSDNPLGTVTSVSVVSTNGFAGTVANATTTPAITMTTTVTGLLKGNGTAISAATAGTDYAGISTSNTFSNNQVISVNSSSNALRITQTGAGNALVVEDSANPDSTPFVVDSSGLVIQGNSSPFSIAGNTSYVQQHGTSAQTSAIASVRWQSTSSAGPQYIFGKSKSGVVGTYSVVANGENLGTINFVGDDGTAFVNAAQIQAFVDGTPGTNDMPGRLVFSTTADGASSPTEAMRIDNQQRVGIGAAAPAANNLYVSKTLTGSTSASNVVSLGTVQNDVTVQATYFQTNASVAAGGTVSNLRHFGTYQTAFSGAVTNQYGFNADSSLTGATNNYGFYSNIASGTGRWNFYAAGTASNYFGGDTTISVNSSTDALRITQTGAGNALVVEDSANPDSTPFVVSGDGVVISGYTSAFTLNGAAVRLNIASSGSAYPAAFGYTANSALGANTFFYKSRGADWGTRGIVSSGDTVGQLSFVADDGSSLNSIAAQITAAVDGTPGTNDMPGRLVFSTTRDGASSPTEAMRIDNQQRIGIGGTPGAGVNILASKNITGSTVSYGVWQSNVVQSDVTSNAFLFSTNTGTAASSFTLGALTHYRAAQQSLGAGSAITNQYGYFADASLTGATNNFGFYSNIASSTGRWNFYAAGTADNYFAGNIYLGATTTNANFYNAKTISGAVNSYGFRLVATGDSTVTSNLYGYGSALSTTASAYTLSNLSNFVAFGGVTGAGSTISNQFGFLADSSLTNATNNYGFYSNIASGTGRWNFYAAATAANYFAGSVGIGDAGVTGYNLLVSKNITGSAYSYGIGNYGTVQSNVTTEARYLAITTSTAAASFTLPDLRGIAIFQGTFGAGSTVTNQVAYYAGNNITGATNNYGFYSNIASGTGRWNFYAAGTAANYFGGKTYVAANTEFVVGGVDIATNPQLISDGTYLQLNAPAGSADIRFRIAGAERMRLDSSGNLLVGTTTAFSKLSVVSSGDVAFFQTTGSTSTCGYAKVPGNTAYYWLWQNSSGSNIAYIRTTDGTTVTYNTGSDERLKENIVDSGSSVQKINNIKVRAFNWKSTGKKVDYGFIAQELNETAPEAVSQGKDNDDGSIDVPWGVDNSVLVPALVKAIQELTQRLEALEAK